MAKIRIAAAGDIHCSPRTAPALSRAFREMDEEADLVLLAGDLTTYGQPEQARLLADICRAASVPIVAVLGNHDWHSNCADEVRDELERSRVTVLDRSWTTLELLGTRIGIVGTKGFVGGFPDSELPDFGEPLLRQVYAETSADVDALERGLAAVADCSLRIALLHYAPTTTTLEGEPRVIWAFLGSDRMAAPIARHRPDLVLHGHAHAGTFDGAIGDVPVYNVAVPVIGRDFWVFELDGAVEPEEPADVQVESEPAPVAPGARH